MRRIRTSQQVKLFFDPPYICAVIALATKIVRFSSIDMWEIAIGNWYLQKCAKLGPAVAIFPVQNDQLITCIVAFKERDDLILMALVEFKKLFLKPMGVGMAISKHLSVFPRMRAQAVLLQAAQPDFRRFPYCENEFCTPAIALEQILVCQWIGPVLECVMCIAYCIQRFLFTI